LFWGRLGGAIAIGVRQWFSVAAHYQNWPQRWP
jgi:hypothetical protein